MDNIKNKTHFKKTMEKVLKSLDTAFVKLDIFLHELMQPVITAKMVPEKDWKAIEENFDLLLYTFNKAKEAGMMGIVLHPNTL